MHWFELTVVDVSILVNNVAHIIIQSSTKKLVFPVMSLIILQVTSCPRSHRYLREILPRLSDCLHDVNESVKSAMLDLLLVKTLAQCNFSFIYRQVVTTLPT